MVKIICDDGWWTGIKLLAVDVLANYQEGNIIKLREICEEIYSGKINDPQDSLLGRVLSILYPTAISELEILKYLKLPRESFSLLEQYEYFWRYELPNKSNPKQLSVILDQLTEKFYALPLEARSKGITRYSPRCFTSIILYHFLQKSENDIDLDKLFKWLGVTYRANSTHKLNSFESSQIRQWLSNHPDIWKSLLSKSVNECSKNSESYDELFRCLHLEKKGRLFDFVSPSDFCDWCLDQALIAENPIAARWYITQLANHFYEGNCNKNLNLKTISNALENRGKLHTIFNERIKLPNNQQSAEINSGWPNQNLQGRPNWHDQVKPYEKEIRNNTVSPVLLHNLAEVYFGECDDVPEGNSPRERLEHVLNGDQDLVDAVILSFSESLLRNDLPTVSNIIKLDSQYKRHPLSSPLLAGFEEKSKEGESFLPKLEDKYLRLCVAVYITSILSKYLEQQYPPSWYNWILSNHPMIVTDVLVEYALTTLRSKTSRTKHLYDLSFSKEYEEVAKYAAFRILKRFPVRCKADQLTQLGYLFFAARKHNSQNLPELVSKKLKHKSMNIEQRIYWLALGLCIDPETYIKNVIDEIPRNERRIRYFANTIEKKFFSLQPDLEVEQRVEIIKQIIKHLGGSFFPYQLQLISGRAVTVTIEMTYADMVRDYIKQLSTLPFKKATHALKELVSDKQLIRWKNYLEDAYQQQVVTRREAEFKYCGLENVLGTLENKKPSNPADLTALTCDYLNEIGNNIRNSSSSDWKQYWIVDSHECPQKPLQENLCRDNLLSDLNYKLQSLGIDGQPEGTYANDKRSDIRISFPPFNVPIEIKRSCHKNLWTSIQSQLIAKYTRDPHSEGYGIYVVFWFGESESCKPQISPKGTRPSSPDELHQQLVNSLTSEQKNKIKVCVIDVSNQKIS